MKKPTIFIGIMLICNLMFTNVMAKINPSVVQATIDEITAQSPSQKSILKKGLNK